MLLSTHPDLMSDEELGQWLLQLVSLKTSESVFLDYKETIKTEPERERREIAKDISSFANEQGGIVLYGVPEEKKSHQCRSILTTLAWTRYPAFHRS